jgi:hypothetical protein
MAKTCVFENKGVIFGGYARDTIVSDHFKSIFNSANKYNINKFWNRFYQPETAARTIIPRDMDICMYSLGDVELFTTAIQNIFNDRAGYSNVSLTDTTLSRESCYFGIPVIIHKHISVKITVGKIPFVHSGVEIVLDFDIIVPRNKKLEPPFYKVDLLSNVFLLTKQGMLISNHTGTIIDKMSILDKQKISVLIMSDIVEFKTEFCMENYTDRYDCGNFRYNSKVVERINKMLFRSFPLEITNLPLELEVFKEDNNENNMCCICQSNFKNKELTANIYSDNPSKTKKICTMTSHRKCLFKYLDTQVENAQMDRLEATDKFEFRCPMRNAINFKKYASNIDAIIGEKMSGLNGARRR